MEAASEWERVGTSAQVRVNRSHRMIGAAIAEGVQSASPGRICAVREFWALLSGFGWKSVDDQNETTCYSYRNRQPSWNWTLKVDIKPRNGEMEKLRPPRSPVPIAFSRVIHRGPGFRCLPHSTLPVGISSQHFMTSAENSHRTERQQKAEGRITR